MRIPTRILLAALLLLATPAMSTADDEHADLSGEWVLNTAASDDPDAVMRRAFAGRRGGGSGDGMGRGGGMRRGGGSGGGNRPRKDEERGNPGSRLLERYRTLTVFQEADEIDLTDGLDISRFLHIDGKAEKVWTERGQAMATAGWNGDTLQILWQGGGGERTSSYTLSEDARQLVLVDEITRPGGDDKVELRLVYDRVGGRSDPASK